MSPPLYADLDKKCKDIFTKGYSFGLMKLDCKTRTSSGIEFTAGGNSNIDTGKVFGNLETKYKLEDHGLTLCEKWNTDNLLVTEITFQKDSVVPGVKASFDTTFAPSSGQKSGRVKAEFKQDLFALNCIADVLTTGPLFHASAVAGQAGWLAGGQISYDSATSQITQNSIGVGYDIGNLAIISCVGDGHEYSGAVYHRVNDQLETGVQLAWTGGSEGGTARFGLGAKYVINNEITVGGKLNNLSQLGLCYQHKFNNNVTGTISALIDGRNLAQGAHKIGLSLDVEI